MAGAKHGVGSPVGDCRCTTRWTTGRGAERTTGRGAERTTGRSASGRITASLSERDA
jgi:hypothetical protein